MSTSRAPQIAFPAANEDLQAARIRCSRACRRYNTLSDDVSPTKRAELWHDITNPTQPFTPPTTLSPGMAPAFFGGPIIKSPVHVDYGINLRIAASTFINRNFTCLDTPLVPVIIRERCLIGPNVSIYCVGHPLDWRERLDGVLGAKGRGGPSLARGVTIEDDVWISGGAIILGGVHIGSGAVIGAGSVVTRDIPGGHLAVGSPARVIRKVAADVPDIPGFDYPFSAPASVAETLKEVDKLDKSQTSRPVAEQILHTVTAPEMEHQSYEENENSKIVQGFQRETANVIGSEPGEEQRGRGKITDRDTNRWLAPLAGLLLALVVTQLFLILQLWKTKNQETRASPGRPS